MPKPDPAIAFAHAQAGREHLDQLAAYLQVTPEDLTTALRKLATPTTDERTIDDCPRCDQPVDQVTNSPDGRRNAWRALPCNHTVTVTIWPTHIALATR